MADRVFFFADSPTELLGGHLVPSQMVEDLLVIAEIPSEVIDRVVAVLDSAVGFLNEEGLKKLVQEVISEERQASAVISAIQSIQSGRIDWVLRSLNDWRGANAENAKRVSDQIFAKIERNLAKLIKVYPAWDRFQKG